MLVSTSRAGPGRTDRSRRPKSRLLSMFAFAFGLPLMLVHSLGDTLSKALSRTVARWPEGWLARRLMTQPIERPTLGVIFNVMLKPQPGPAPVGRPEVGLCIKPAIGPSSFSAVTFETSIETAFPSSALSTQHSIDRREVDRTAPSALFALVARIRTALIEVAMAFRTAAGQPTLPMSGGAAVSL